MEIAKLFTGKLNLDNVIEAIPEGDYTYMLDGVIGTSKDGKRGSIENMMGTSTVTGTADLDSNSTCIGGCRDAKTNDYYLFFHNTNSSKNTIVKITVANSGGSVTYTASKVLTWSGLNFDKYKKIHACYVNGYLYFTDGLNEVKGFNVTKYTSSSPASEDEITLIRRGGIYAPTVTKVNSSSSINLIKNYDFQFAYQYLYEDGQISVLSPYSKLVRKNISSELYDKITVTLPESVPALVKEVKFVVRIGNTGSFQYFASLKKINGAWSTTAVDFYNTVYGGVVPTDYLNLNHDVPVTSNTIEFIKNRLFLGNIKTGLDLLDPVNISISQTYTNLQLNSTQIITATFNNITEYSYNAYSVTVNGQPYMRFEYTTSNTAYGIIYQGSNQGSWSVGGKQVQLNSGAYDIINQNYFVHMKNLNF